MPNASVAEETGNDPACPFRVHLISNQASDQLLNSSKMAETVRFELTVLFRVTLR